MRRKIGDVSERWVGLWRYRNDCLDYFESAMARPGQYFRTFAELEACMWGHELAYRELQGAESVRDFARAIGPGFNSAFRHWLSDNKHQNGAAVPWATTLQDYLGLEGWEEGSPAFDLLRAFFDEWVPEPRRRRDSD